MPDKKGKIVIICGPTASGKSGLGMQLAPEFSGEIVIADSRQIYKDLDIGTSKPTKEEQEAIPHHLVDICKPGIDFSAAEYKKNATKAINEIIHRKNLPFMIGGTGLYIDTVAKGLSMPNVKADPKLRQELEAKSLEDLNKELKILDPVFSQKIDPKNKRRLVRALEVCIKTGKKYSDLRKTEDVPYDILWLARDWPREELYQRIDLVIDKMLEDGLRQEIEHLLKKDISPEWLERIGLEYRFMTQIIQGKITKEEGVQKLKYASHQFAKRQMTWFGKNKNIHWLKPMDISTPKKLVKDFITA